MFWKKIEGDCLEQSRRHGAIVYQDNLYIFCGNIYSPFSTSNPSNDFYRFSFKEKSFSRINPKKNIIPTFGFSYSLYNDQIYLFTVEFKASTLKNSIYTFNFTDLTWKRLVFELKITPRRYGSTMVAFKGKLIITGGEFLEKSSDFVLEYDIEKNTLKTIETNWELPPIFAHQCIKYKGGMYLFGGKNKNHYRYDHLYYFDLESYKWEKISSFGKPPSGRAGHSMNECLGKIYIYGGFNGTNDLNDLYQYDIESKVWKELVTFNSPNPSNFTSLNAYCDKGEVFLYLYGGITFPLGSRNHEDYTIFKDFHEISVFNIFMNHIYSNTSNLKDIQIYFD